MYPMSWTEVLYEGIPKAARFDLIISGAVAVYEVGCGDADAGRSESI